MSKRSKFKHDFDICTPLYNETERFYIDKAIDNLRLVSSLIDNRLGALNESSLDCLICDLLVEKMK